MRCTFNNFPMTAPCMCEIFCVALSVSQWVYSVGSTFFVVVVKMKNGSSFFYMYTFRVVHVF